MAMNPVDVVVVGTALNTHGFIGNNTTSGLGLNTRGFLWPCDGIWTPSDAFITTTWVPASIATSTTEVCTDDMGGFG
jgi:hypothetical protein